jgi:hypothetical protein
MASKDRVLRFAVGSPVGPQGAVWRLWADQNGNIYVGARSICDKFKASLHASGRWRIGYSEAEMRRLSLPEGADRAVVKWSAPQKVQAGEAQLIFLVFVPASEVVSPPNPTSSDSSIFWHPTSTPATRAVFSIWVSGSDTEMRGTLVGKVSIPGKTIWCFVRNEADDAAARANREGDRRKLLDHLGGTFPDAAPKSIRSVLVTEITGGPMCFVDLVLR